VAGIVEAHKALTDYLRHCQSAKCGCEWLPLTYSVGPDSECETGKALAEKVRAAEVKPAQ
jgi:hypothetical protein